jgi:hypothetical protein
MAVARATPAPATTSARRRQTVYPRSGPVYASIHPVELDLDLDTVVVVVVVHDAVVGVDDLVDGDVDVTTAPTSTSDVNV